MHNKRVLSYRFAKYQTLIIASAAVGFLAGLLAVSLKRITEHYEEILYHKATTGTLYFFVLPLAGLSLIYLLRRYLFKNKENKGIKEVFDSTVTGKGLPAYKIPSHFVNGLLTVSFGGSTGIEVSTVVSSAAVGSIAHDKEVVLKKHKTELICAGVTAGVTGLFCSPAAGLLFAYEVIAKKRGKYFFMAVLPAVLIAWALIFMLDEQPLFAMNIISWHLYAIPYFILLGVIAGINSVYLTKSVIYCKAQFAKITRQYNRIILGAVIISGTIVLLPQLYGDGYHAIKENIAAAGSLRFTWPFVLTLLGVLLLKPVITSVTLSAGGDGGVFAPSIFIGAFLGLLIAMLLNTFFDAGVIPLNFMVIGMAAMLSAAIHAPFTAIFLACGLVGDYTLFVPILIACLVAKYTAKAICPYNVYTYSQYRPAS